MKKKIAVIGATLVSVLLPVMVFAQASASTTCVGVSGYGGVEEAICKIYDIVNLASRVLLAIAVLYFIWGVIQYVIAGDAEEKSSARSVMIHGIIGFAVILGLWGIVTLLLRTFGVNNGTVPQIPVFGQ